MAKGGGDIKQLRYRVMLALYLPILLYSFSTFDLKEETVAAKKVTPILVGGQSTVVLGQDYTANAYLQAEKLAKGKEIVLKSDDEKVVVEENQNIQIATADLLSEGEDQKEVEYSVKMEYGQLKGTTAETLTGSFTVRRPQLVSKSVATNSLYRKTLNKIRINVPGLEGQPLELSSSAGGRTEGRQLSISPSSDSVTVRAYLPKEEGESVYLGSKGFSVIDPPRPQLKVLDARGEQLTSGDPLSVAQPALNFKVEPDAEFESSYAQDANYRIKKAKVSIRRGLKASEEIDTFNIGEDATLKGELIRSFNRVRAKAKDNLIVQLQDVVRVNHAGEEIPIDLNESNLSYSFTLSR